jgi:lipoprotein-anchoring transpeptidase ErfK/SrfK
MIDFKNKKILIPVIVLGSLVFLFIVLLIIGHILAAGNRFPWEDYLKDQKIEARMLQQMVYKNKLLKKKIEKYSQRGTYLVIDTASNILYVKKGTQILHQVTVSCGSGNILREPDGSRRWVFDTPMGEFVVQSKLRDPVWVKPDWAFIEEGKAVPKEEKERLEPGVLGEYALGFGDGYFIHGTLYTRMLGRNVTHGCIRVGDKDLEILYRLVSVGTKLYIF